VASNDPSDVPTRTAVLEHRADATDRTLESLRHEIAEFRREVSDRFDRMADRMDQHLRWVITTVITMAVAIVGANVGILTCSCAPAETGRAGECLEPLLHDVSRGRRALRRDGAPEDQTSGYGRLTGAFR
jgi:hypothetical protein